MLLSHDRLNSLIEQEEYLHKLHDFIVKRNTEFHNKTFLNSKYGSGNEELCESLKQMEISNDTFREWDEAGLVQATKRIKLEIAFLKDYLEVP